MRGNSGIALGAVVKHRRCPHYRRRVARGLSVWQEEDLKERASARFRSGRTARQRAGSGDMRNERCVALNAPAGIW